MIIGIGTDAVEISRIEKSLQIPGFKESTFTSNEILNEHGNVFEYYATRLACKEAVFKALHKWFDWRIVETLNRDDGSPFITPNEIYDKCKVHISISTEAGLAIAYCVIEKIDCM